MLRALYRRQPLTPLHWSWLVAIFVAQLVYATVLPMFEGPDEIGHYYRMWALSQGHFACDTVPGSVTTTAHSMLHKAAKQPLVAPPEPWRDYLKRGAAIAADDTRVSGWGYECFYFPSGLLAQALANRVVAEHLDGRMRVGGAFIGAYAARAAEAVVVDSALVFALMSLPRGRFTLLAFFSIPEVIQQSSCINHDAFLFVLTLLIAVAALARPSWRAVLAIGVMASLMAAVKPVYALFGLCGLPQLTQLWTREHRFSWWRWLVSLTLLLPLTTYYLLRRFTVDANRLWHPSFANPELQWKLLKQHPLRLFEIFVGYFHYFIDDHKQPDFFPRLINGKWTTLLAGTAQFDMALPGLLAVIAGLCLAIIADLYSQPPLATAPAPSARVGWAWRIAIAAVVATIPLTIVALYLIFSHVGADYPYGVQGRYHLFTLLLLFIFTIVRIRGPRRRESLRRLAIPALALFIIGYGYAISEVYRFYWLYPRPL